MTETAAMDHHHDGPVGGWGSLKGLSKVALREAPNPITLTKELARENKHSGFMCVSCALSKPTKSDAAEFCETGARATAWDLTRYRCTPDFFSEHTLTELRGWRDFVLEHQGRLTAPMRYKAVLAASPKVDWTSGTEDYARIRDAIAETYPQWFKDFNARLAEPGGFYRPNKARERDFFDTETGKANFFLPGRLSATGFADEPGLFRLMTLRSNDQFNTTIYGYEDKLREVSGTRDIVFMNPEDILEHGLKDGEAIGLATQDPDGISRRKLGLKVFAYNVPRGCLCAYYPECNVLVPLHHHAEESKVPAGKSVPVRIIRP